MPNYSKHECWLLLGSQRYGPFTCRLVEEASIFDNVQPHYSWQGLLLLDAGSSLHPLQASQLFDKSHLVLLLDDGRSGGVQFSRTSASLTSGQGEIGFTGSGMLSIKETDR